MSKQSDALVLSECVKKRRRLSSVWMSKQRKQRLKKENNLRDVSALFECVKKEKKGRRSSIWISEQGKQLTDQVLCGCLNKECENREHNDYMLRFLCTRWYIIRSFRSALLDVSSNFSCCWLSCSNMSQIVTCSLSLSLSCVCVCVFWDIRIGQKHYLTPFSHIYFNETKASCRFVVNTFRHPRHILNLAQKKPDQTLLRNII